MTAITLTPAPDARPYRADPASRFRVRFDAHVAFTSGGHVEVRDFLLDIPDAGITPERLAEMVGSAMNLRRAGPVTITRMEIVERGAHDDAAPTAAALATPEAVRGHYGEVRALAAAKCIDRLDAWARRFIALSPFCIVASADARGWCDATPRGDAPGFVRVLDDATLLIPDRPGNRRFDSLDNIARQPRLALLFMVPGVEETLRVNGRGRTVDDPGLLAPSAVNGRPPLSGLLVEIEECFLHCGKALIRSRLWDPETRIERRSFPSLARMIADQIAGVDERAADEAIEHAYREKLY